jgi:TonB family protein
LSSDRVFQIAILISLVAHAVILWQSPNFGLFSSRKQENTNVELRYIKPPEETKPPLKALSPKEEPFLKMPPKITAEENRLRPSIDKEDIFKKNKGGSVSQKYTFAKPALIKPDIIAVKKKITLSPPTAEKTESPNYIAYSQIIREKIKRALYQNYNSMEIGEVYLAFILSRDGYIKEVRLIEEKSSSSAYLRETALRSIRDASPFPDFPKKLDYDQLSFNVIVSFEIE